MCDRKPRPTLLIGTLRYYGLRTGGTLGLGRDICVLLSSRRCVVEGFHVVQRGVVRGTEDGRGGKQLPIHSLKWNPNDVLTTCKAIYEVLVSGYTFYACADVACSNGTRTLKGRKLWWPKAADSVLSIRLGNWRIDRILHFYHVSVHFASYEDKSLLSKFFSRKVEQ